MLSLLFVLFLLTFFTIHFGGFHFVHSVFLNLFFPVVDPKSFPSEGLYTEVFRRYWPFLTAAFLAERAALRTAWNAPLDFRQRGGQNVLGAPYRNVVRMHLLIFFFAFASDDGARLVRGLRGGVRGLLLPLADDPGAPGTGGAEHEPVGAALRGRPRAPGSRARDIAPLQDSTAARRGGTIMVTRT